MPFDESLMDESCDPARLENWTMAAKLPYTLTAGVVATKDGLRVLDAIQLNAIADLAGFAVWKQHSRLPTTPIISWPIIADRLRYRDGEPWVRAHYKTPTLVCEPYDESNEVFDGQRLHRLAAILCDDAEAFRVLHWCVHNLGGRQSAV
jgi:hypothetical protein